MSDKTIIHHGELDVLEVIHEDAYSPSGAVLSDDAACRFLLWRRWDTSSRRRAVFIGLNPSTADANADDPTIRRCIGFARAWGCSGLLMVNVFPTRSTDPAGIDPDQAVSANSLYVGLAIAATDTAVGAWGSHKLARTGWNRLTITRAPRQRLQCLGTNKDGSPKHPLYIAASTPLAPWLGYPL